MTIRNDNTDIGLNLLSGIQNQFNTDIYFKLLINDINQFYDWYNN